MSHIVRAVLIATFLGVLVVPMRMAAAQSVPQYILIDLGTFGGPNAFLFNDQQGLNNQGMVMGSADTTTPVPPVFCFGDCFLSHTFVWQHGVKTDLGALPGPDNSSGIGWISNNGVIAGLSQNGAIDPTNGQSELRGVLWKDGRITDLGTFGGNWSVANAVNDRGQVAGGAFNTTPDPFGLAMAGLPGTTQSRAFLWQGGVMKDLGTLGGPDSTALFINDAGQIAGMSYTSASPNPTTQQPTEDPFLWVNGTMRDLGSLGGTVGVVAGLNAGGEVVGQSSVAGDTSFHPFLWNGTRMIDLGTLGGTYGAAYWINDAGDVVGYSTPAGDLTAHAFLWKNGEMTDLGTVPGQPCSFANSVNSSDQVVGGSCTSGGNGWLWEHGNLHDLNTLVAPTVIHLTEAKNINDRGEILGFGILPNGDQHDVLLVPAGLAASEGLTSNVPTSRTGSATTPPASSPAQIELSPLLHGARSRDHRFGER